MTDPILIAGGGIGGLSAAIALAREGQQAHVLERSATLSEAGSGIQLGPNAFNILKEWGLEDLIRPFAVKLSDIRVHDGLTGELLNTVRLGLECQRRYDVPYLVIRRAHLQKCLLDVAASDARIKVTTGFSLSGLEIGDTSVKVRDDAGQTLEGLVLIGADGLQSTVRRSLMDNEPETLGMTAWRTILPAADIPDDFAERKIGVWMGPGSHIVHYPIDGGESLDVVAIIDDTYHFDGWGEPGDPEDLLPHFVDWDDKPLSLLNTAADWQKWTLFKMSPLVSWGHGPVTLLGDAAHPIPPLLAQGAAMAIEDAATLAAQIAARPDDTATALRRYEAARQTRTAKVQRASLALGRVYHYSGPSRWARNSLLRNLAPEKMVGRYDWIYGFATDEVKESDPAAIRPSEAGNQAETCP